MVRHSVIAFPAMGITEVITAPRSPWQNPYAERLIGLIRRECLDHVILFSERHLRRVLSSYFHHDTRTHRTRAGARWRRRWRRRDRLPARCQAGGWAAPGAAAHIAIAKASAVEPDEDGRGALLLRQIDRAPRRRSSWFPGAPQLKEDKKGSEPNAAENKAVNDVVAFRRSLAQLRGRDLDFANKAVCEAATLTADEARKQGVVEIVASSVDDVLAQPHGASSPSAAKSARFPRAMRPSSRSSGTGGPSCSGSLSIQISRSSCC
jgi:hypothetical protein